MNIPSGLVIYIISDSIKEKGKETIRESILERPKVLFDFVGTIFPMAKVVIEY